MATSLKLGSGELSVVTISPVQAAEMLKHLHPNQRRLKKRQVAAIARSLSAGTWRDTADPIRVDRQMRVLDGQHRLQACVLSKKALKEVAFYKMSDSKAIEYIDTAIAKRSVHDMRRALGEDHVPHNIHSGLAIEGCDFDWALRRTLNLIEANRIVREYPQLATILRINRVAVDRVPVGCIAGAARVIRKVRKDGSAFMAAAFANEGFTQTHDAPQATALFAWMNKQRVSGMGRGGSPDQISAQAVATVSFYNAWASGEAAPTTVRFKGKLVPDVVR